MRLHYCYSLNRLFFLLLMLICLLSRNVYALDYTDAVGRVVHLSAPPQRIVSLVPSVTEILYAIHADTQLVGVTDFCNFPPQAQQKTVVGAYNNPGLETVASLVPDLIIMDVASSSPALLHQFEQLEVPVYVVAPKSLATTLETISALGRVTGHQKSAIDMVNGLNAQIDEVVKMRSDKPLRTLVCVMIEPLIVAGAGTLADDLIHLAGGVNVAAGLARYPTLSMETVLQYDPDVIIVSPHPGTPTPADFFAEWPQLKAVSKQQVFNVEADLLQRPGPRLVSGLIKLAQCYNSLPVAEPVLKNRHVH
ncbi:MAG: cobalamin-binding protein [Desulfuromonas sp.]|nr:cobalamin-binding protein [Desulfuromonas sp.]